MRNEFKRNVSKDYSGYLAFWGTLSEADDNQTIKLIGIRLDLQRPYVVLKRNIRFEKTDEYPDTRVSYNFLKRNVGNQAYVFYIYGDSSLPQQSDITIAVYGKNGATEATSYPISESSQDF